MQSRPLRISGIQARWISVGWIIDVAERDWTSHGETERDRNVVEVVLMPFSMLLESRDRGTSHFSCLILDVGSSVGGIADASSLGSSERRRRFEGGCGEPLYLLSVLLLEDGLCDGVSSTRTRDSAMVVEVQVVYATTFFDEPGSVVTQGLN
jgi:hypothetical protein